MPITAQPIIQEVIDAAAIRRLAEGKGMCLSFFLPDQKPGMSAGTHHSLLRQLARDAKPEAGELADAVNGLLADNRLKGNGPGLAIFCSAGTVEAFQVRGIQEPAFVTGQHFHLLPLLPTAFAPRQMFILGLARGHMRLFRYQDGAVTEETWPTTVPSSLDEAEHGRVEAIGNHASSGMSPSLMSSVQFGSSVRPDREGAGHHLTHFYQLVDAGLAPVLAGAPLLLGGVADDIAAYRKAAKYRAVLGQELAGSLEHKRASQLTELVHEVSTDLYFTESERVLAACVELKNKLEDSQEIEKAALDGRVSRLCVSQEARPLETCTAVAATLCAGGEVFAVRGKGSMVAALRY